MRPQTRIWQPWTWRDFTASQQPDWNLGELEEATKSISALPPLVSAQEIEVLKEKIGLAASGRAFVLQGGDCAERFQDCNEIHISGRLKILMQMSLVLGYGARTPIVTIGRMAGQYAKPRSELLEYTSDGMIVNSFRGENINSFKATEEGRKPDAKRLVQSYHYSGATLNFIRTVMQDGFAELRNLDKWQICSLKKDLSWARYERIVTGLKEFFSMMEYMGRSSVAEPSSSSTQEAFFVSHEALVLPYEEALTRYVPSLGRWYNLGAHYLWIGDRTRHLDGAHLEYCRGVGNPIAVKVGADSDPNDILQLIDVLNPHREIGKVTLITRYGSNEVKRCLPKMIEAIQVSGVDVTWSIDPMHGNTERLADGRKTRDIANISDEIASAFEIHKKFGSHVGGVHLEMTHDPVTECLGGSDFMNPQDLSKRYETWCDPRLNGSQALGVSFYISSLMAQDT